MKYKLNELPIKTTNNFKINDVEVELDLNELNTNKFYDIKGIKVEQKIIKSNITSKIGLEFKKYLEVKINISKVYNEPIYITYNFSNNDTLISNLIINYEENSKADIIIKYISDDNNKHFNYLKEEVIAKENSKGIVTYLNNLNSKSTNMIAFLDQVDDNASITHNLIDLKGNIRIYNAYMESNGYSSKNYFNNIYIGKNNDLIDINYYFKNIGKKSYNDLKVEGVLDGNSSKKFRGTIDFIEGSTNSVGKEYENCLLLTDQCRSRSLPMMLCHEESVEGAHGESTGKIDEDKLFYLMCKGLTKKDAEKLIIMSNFTNILNNLNDTQLKDEIISLIEELI